MVEVSLGGVELIFETGPGLFSQERADRGTLAMLSAARIGEGDKVLDLGCGWGLVGVYAARLAGGGNVTMLDIDPAAVRVAGENAVRNGVGEVRCVLSDGYDSLDDAGYDIILCNPPYNSDFSVARRFIEKGFNRLALGGRMYMVTKRREWYLNKLRAIFGGCRIYDIDGYFVFEAEKRSGSYAGRQ